MPQATSRRRRRSSRSGDDTPTTDSPAFTDDAVSETATLDRPDEAESSESPSRRRSRSRRSAKPKTSEAIGFGDDSSEETAGDDESKAEKKSPRKTDRKAADTGRGAKPKSPKKTTGTKAAPRKTGDKKPSGARTGSEDRPSDVTFADLGLSDEQLEILDDLGYETPTPVQAQTLPIALEGRDCIGQAPTGTGKTAAFTLPILHHLDPDAHGVQAIILSPTRELAEQVAQEAQRLAGGPKNAAGTKLAVIVGGRPMGPQTKALQGGAQIVVGTPGRVIDLINRGLLNLADVRFAVLDEADRMLDFGFRPDIEKILRRCPQDRQTLLFSATMPKEVMRLVDRYQKSPEVVDLSEKTTSEQVEQYVCNVDADRKFPLLVRLLAQEKPRQVIVFSRTKRGADKLAAQFGRVLPEVDVLHGDLPQSKRDRVMKRFRGGKTRMLIATDIVGRGIDVSYVSHIVNYDVPEDCDDYVHRVGRTGRISSKTAGKAFTFATRSDGNELTRIEQRINRLLEPYDFGISSMRDRESEVKTYDGRLTDNEIADDFGSLD